MRRVAVLLSTYDGAPFVAEQVESVLAQQGVDVALLVRDDGSRDATLRILERWRDDRRVAVFAESNVGVVASFFRVLELATCEADYFAFCDQDDVWQPDKLRRAVEALDRTDAARPQLYSARLTVAAEDLRPIGESRLPSRPLAFENAVVENVVTGCTAVFNRRAREALLSRPHGGALVHDWWTYLVVSAFGEVHYDPTPRILYRQHARNVIGVAPGTLSRWVRRVQRVMAGDRKRVLPQIEAFRASFADALSPSQRRVLDELINASHAGLFARLGTALSTPVYRQTALDNLALRALIACGLL